MIGMLKSRISMSVMTLLFFPVLSHAENLNERFSSKIEQATQATVGILQHADDVDSQATKTHFSIRGSGFHLRDGYIVTARHAVERQEGGKTVIPKDISVMTGMLEELPAKLVGVNAFVDLAVYQVEISATSLSLADVSFAEGHAGTRGSTLYRRLSAWGGARPWGLADWET